MSGAALGWFVDREPSAPRTLRRMGRMVQDVIGQPNVIYAANRVIEAPNSRDYPLQIAAIRQWMQRRFKFVGNPGELQAVRPVDFLLRDMDARGFTQGSCADAALLIATMATANGIPARFRALAFCFRPDGACDSEEPYSHVIADLHDGRQWCELDVTKPYDLERAPHVLRTLEYDIS
jgi:transglutaminase-like putative cysteine protease